MKSAQEAMEEQASPYDKIDGYGHDKSFKAGWQAATEYYKSLAPEFNKTLFYEWEWAAGRQSPTLTMCAEYGFEQGAAALGVARAEIEELKKYIQHNLK